MGRTRTQRRSKGEGTIYKTTVKRRGVERLVFRAELQYTDADGLEQRRSAQRESESKARAMLERWRLERSIKGGIAKQTVAKGPTFSEYADSWLARRKPEIGTGTYRQYEGNLRRDLKPFFTHRLVKRIGQDDVTAFLGTFTSHRKKGARRGETGETTRKQCLGVLKQIFADAVEDGLVERVPFRVTGRRRVKMLVERREMHVIDIDQQRAFIAAASGNRYEALFVLGLASGMRQGELLGLRWGHVQDDHIVVQRRLDARTRTQKQTKSKSGQRRIEIDVATMEHLEAHRDRMAAEGISTGPRDLVFVNHAGKAISASNLVDREFRPIVEAAGISDEFRFHDLRHSHATLLLSGGMNPKVVQERLGHESVKTTLDLYGHVLPTAQRDAATLVGNVLYSGKSLTSSLSTVRQRRARTSADKKKALTA